MAKIDPVVEEVKVVSEIDGLKAQIEALTKMVKGTADGNKLDAYESKNKKKKNSMFRVSYLQDDPETDPQYVQSYRIKKDEARNSSENFRDANTQIYEVIFVGESKPKQMNIQQFNYNLKKTDPIESIRIATDQDGLKLVTLPINKVEIIFDSRYLN